MPLSASMGPSLRPEMVIKLVQDHKGIVKYVSVHGVNLSLFWNVHGIRRPPLPLDRADGHFRRIYPVKAAQHLQGLFRLPVEDQVDYFCLRHDVRHRHDIVGETGSYKEK
jgi:hypothetical protein